MKTAYIELPYGSVIETDSPELWTEGKRLTVKAGKAALVAEARERLLEMLQPGSTVYTQVRHVSGSGMSRRISAYVIRDNEPWNISGYVARVLDWPCDRDELSVRVSGCGMDMGFHLVYSLSATLFPRGADNSDGGYALKQRRL